MDEDAITNGQQSATAYKTLREIRQRRRQLEREINAETKQMKRLRRQLFSSGTTAGRRKGKRFSVSTILTTGSGLLDGALLAFKLYRRFKK